LDANINAFSEYNREYYQEYKVKIISEKETPQKILDFGCGIGTGCKYLKKYFPNAEITGIDVSDECINTAKEIDGINALSYDGENIPFENEFDLIYSSCVFHHIKKSQHPTILKQLSKALNKDGKIYIFEHNPLNPLTQKIVRDCPFDKNAELVFPNEFKKIVDCKINYTLFIPRFKFLKNLFFIEKYLTKIPFGAQYYCVIKPNVNNRK